LEVEEFFDELTELVSLYRAKLAADNDPRLNYEQIPYVMFLEFYKKRPRWEMHICNIESPFMKLLQLDKLFFVKKIIKMEKDN
jgi:hypothetical protein